ncbi:hypothetical protein NE237_006879 [Protea cynaroides]|uniref:Uncharacterized protein n=1 Tax=Protea cynaroides TaxID=273540 RepID=A0A9Q0QVK7_9MAGN|nr:hypothetical protein NE237_006879 [Protea cynaroides]
MGLATLCIHVDEASQAMKDSFSRQKSLISVDHFKAMKGSFSRPKGLISVPCFRFSLRKILERARRVDAHTNRVSHYSTVRRVDCSEAKKKSNGHPPYLHSCSPRGFVKSSTYLAQGGRRSAFFGSTKTPTLVFLPPILFDAPCSSCLRLLPI